MADDRLAALEQFAKDMRKALELLEDDEVPSAVRTALGQLEADLSSAPARNVGCGDKEMTSSQIRDACLLGASHLRAQARRYRDGAEDEAENPHKLDKRVVNGLVKDMKKSAEKTDASAAILARLAEHAEALSSTALAPCPPRPATPTEVEATLAMLEIDEWERQQAEAKRQKPAPCSTEQPICPGLGGECPRCSAQPAPSDAPADLIRTAFRLMRGADPVTGKWWALDPKDIDNFVECLASLRPAPSDVVMVPREIAEWVHALLTRRLVPWEGKFTISEREERDKRWAEALAAALRQGGG